MPSFFIPPDTCPFPSLKPKIHPKFSHEISLNKLKSSAKVLGRLLLFTYFFSLLSPVPAPMLSKT